MTSPPDLLRVDGITRSFGGVVAVSAVSFSVTSGTICAVIGPNGAGKTTLLDLVTGLTRPDAGDVFFDGRRITGTAPYHLPTLGLMRTFQSTRLIPGLSVRENLALGAHHLTRTGFVSAGLRLRRARQEEQALRDRAARILAFLRLEEIADRDARNLPTGTQRMVEVGRTLAGGPKLLLLDEPAAGLDDTETALLAELLVAVRSSGVTLLVVEHNVNLVMRLCEQVVVLDAGKVIADGPPRQVQQSPIVQAAYLGGPA
ncbi:MAG: ABC transporter ATP-binding protein [Acidimicrobiales bacterium]